MDGVSRHEGHLVIATRWPGRVRESPKRTNVDGNGPSNGGRPSGSGLTEPRPSKGLWAGANNLCGLIKQPATPSI